MYYRQAKCVFLVFDITARDSFNNLHYWLHNIRKYADPPLIYLIGNKSDLESRRTVSHSEAVNFAKSQSLQYLEISAKNGNGILPAFSKSVRKLVNLQVSLIPTSSHPTFPQSYCSC